MSDGLAIVRQCRRCGEWLSIDVFAPLGRLCKACVSFDPYQSTNRIARIRGYALTDKAREFLAAERATV